MTTPKTPHPCPLADNAFSPCNLAVDIVIQSSEGAFLAAHSKNLSTFSEAFPSLGCSEHSNNETPEVCILPEGTTELLLLLQFMHHGPQPNIRGISMDTLAKLSEAAEKYVVHSALQACKYAMELKMKESPIHVLRYALKHKYHDLCNTVSLLTLEQDPPITRNDIDERHFAVWVTWRDRHNEVKRRVTRIRTKSPTGCFGLEIFKEIALSFIQSEPFTGRQMVECWRMILDRLPCKCTKRQRSQQSCIRRLNNWLNSVEFDIAYCPLALSEFLDTAKP